MPKVVVKRFGLHQARVLLVLEAATAPMTHREVLKAAPQLPNADVAERTLDSLVVRGLVDAPEYRTWALRRDADDRVEALKLAHEIVAQADA